MVCLLSNFLIEKSKARFSLENAIWKRGKTEGKRLKRRERERERETSERDERAREKRTVAIVERPICGPSPHTARAQTPPSVYATATETFGITPRKRERPVPLFTDFVFFENQTFS